MHIPILLIYPIIILTKLYPSGFLIFFIINKNNFINLLYHYNHLNIILLELNLFNLLFYFPSPSPIESISPEPGKKPCSY